MAKEEAPGAAKQAAGAATNYATKKVAQKVTKEVTKQVGKKVAAHAAAAAVSGGTSAAVSAAIEVASRAKTIAKKSIGLGKQAGKIALAGIVAIPSLLVAGVSAAGTGTMTAFGISIMAVPVLFTVIIVIINTGAYIVPIDYGETYTNEDFDESIDASDCPLVNGRLISSRWGSYNPKNETGHGSNDYWDNVISPNGECSYPLPQRAGCFAPTNPSNDCYSSASSSQRCPFYGYSADFITSSAPGVYLPKVNGESLTWNWVSWFSNGSAGQSHVYTDTTGRYTLVFTHIDSALRSSGLESGQLISRLYQWSRPHLHLEFQIDGIYKKPENYFCR